MKKFTISMLTMIISLFLFSVQGQVWTLDFETASGYTTSVTEFTDNSGDYFIRTDGSNILGVYNTPQGSNYFAAMDTDGEPPNADYLTLLADDIPISGFSNLNFKVLIAEDDAGDGNQDWDDDTFLHISYDIDNSGTYTSLIWIEAEGGTNSAPRIDADFNGVGEGTEITDIFQEFSALIAGTGSVIDILVEFNYLDAGDEDIAIDNLRIEELSGNALPVITNVSQNPTFDITLTTPVLVSATITDSDGTVDFVELSWGNATGSLTNPITMSNGGSGDIYTATIPAQGAVIDVFYEIYAEDDAGDGATSAEYSYTTIAAQTTSLPYMEPFDADLGQCYVKSVQGDTKEWNWNAGYAQINGYNSGEIEEDWLILPGINLDSYSNEVMTFDLWRRFGDQGANDYLKLQYSTNYPGIGDPSSFSWTEIYFGQPGVEQTWTTSGAVDLSGITGTMVYIAFEYLDGPAGDGYRWWELDNISIVESTPINVTFSVNMADETVSANGVHIAGSFSNWWDPAAIAMTDSNLDEIYEVTLALYPGTEYQFKYINGNDWSGVESVPLACQVAGYDNRFELTGTADYSLDVVCFSSCTNCGTTTFYDVTFQVDMQNEVVSDDGVYIAGTITDPTWGAGALLMTQAGTIWSTTVSLEEGSTHQYKFINGDPNNGGIWEFIGNRSLTVPSANTVLEVDCFNSTDPCPVADFVMINELDADQTSTDSDEFIELYDGGIGNTSLTGLVVVLYNGSTTDASYNAFDLDGYSTNANGYFVMGSASVPNVDMVIGTTNILQNGADAVALYVGNDTDFPSGTAVTTANLVDALVYDTDDSDDPELLVLLNAGEPQINERGRGDGEGHSNQRIPNGTGGLRNTSTYDQSIPTPGAANSSIFTDWTGFIDNNWDDAGNWTNGIPDGTMGATIPDVSVKAPYPVITGAATCMSLYMATGSGLDIASSGSLTVTGTFTNAGGTLNLKSDASGTGSLIENDGVYATAERYYSGNQWHLISSPVSGETANLFFGLYLQSHDEVSNGYTDIVDETTPLNVMEGYALWDYNIGTAAFVGPVNTGTQSMSLTRTASGFGSGWNLVGNPYPSSIDWLAASGWTKTNVGGTIYLYTGSTWATFSVPGSGTNGGTQYVAPGQGFFVSVNDDGSATGTIGMDNNVRVHNATAFFKDELNNVLKLAVAANGYSDETAIIFMDGATAGFDAQYDAHKLFSLENNVPQIYSTANGFMAANVLPDITSVSIDVTANDGESLNISAIETSEFEHIYLEDIYAGVVTDLNNEAYEFTYFEDVQDRFIVHFAPLAIENNLESNINVYSHQQDVYVNVPENTQGNIVVYNMMGQTVATSQIVGTSTKVTLSESAYYLVKVISNESTVTRKVFIK
jgi:hypothetical protein